MEGEVTALEALWTAVSMVVTNLMTIVGTVGTNILSNTLFQVAFGVGIAYTAVRLFKRLIRIR